MLTSEARVEAWVSCLAGTRPVVLFDSHHAAVAQPVAGRIPGPEAATVSLATGGDSAGVYLLAVAALRLVLRALSEEDRDVRPAVLIPAPGGTGDLALCAPFDPSAPVRVFLDDLHAELEAAATDPMTDRAAVTARLDAADPAASAGFGRLAVVCGDDRLTTIAETTLAVRWDGADLVVTLEGDAGRPPAAISVAPCVAAVLSAIAAAPDRPVGEVDVLGADQRAELMRWSRLPAVGELEPRTVFDPMDQVAISRPDAPAVVDATTLITHGELHDRSWAVGGLLAGKHGIGRGDRVAVLLRRSPELILTILGVLRAGACIVPLDPAHPAQRLARQLELSGARCLVTTDAEALTGHGDIPLIHPAELLAAPAPAEPGAGPGPDDDATMFFTSGSTGRPRPVVITHRQLAHNVIVSGQRVGLDERTRGAMQAAISSDQLAHNIFTPLVVGGSVAPLNPLQQMESAEFWAFLRDIGINAIFCVPSLMAVMAEGLPAGGDHELRHCLLGGDVTPAGLLPRLAKVLRVGTFANMYGPTEATIEAINFVRDGSELPELVSPPIGTPSPGYSVAILTHGGDLAPVGVTGEVYIVGPAVADGYRDDEPTGPGRFVELDVAPGARAFRTGDFGRWRTDGQVEFLGRRDRQIKIHGNRIELREVEAALAAVPGVASCAVAVVADSGPTSAIIGAYTSSIELPPETVRAELAMRLPPVMVPGRILQLDAIPLTPVGKVDPGRIIEAARDDGAERWDPSDEVGRVVARLWTDVVGAPPRSGSEDLYAAGGHSLSAVIIARKSGVDLPDHRITVREILADPTPDGIAGILRRSRVSPAVIAARPSRPALLPASNGQRSMWFLEQYEAGAARPYNTAEAYRLHIPCDAAAIDAALREIVTRHQALRTILRADGDQVEQVVLPAEDAWPEVEVHDVETGRMTEAVRETVGAEQRRRSNLTRPPVLRAHWFTDGTPGGVLILAMHHSACDGWSLAVIVRDLLGLLGALPTTLGGEPVQYADHTLERASRQAGTSASAEFWSRTLAGLPEFSLPLDRQRPAVRDSAAGVARMRLDDRTAEQLRTLCGRLRVTPFPAVVAAIRVLLLRWTGAQDIALGTVVSGRNDPRLENSVGFFVNTVVMRTAVDPQRGYADLVAAVARTAREAREHEEHPFDEVVDAGGRRRIAGRNPIFDVLVEPAFSGHLPGDTDVARLAPHLPVDVTALGFDLAFTVTDAPDGRIEVAVGYRRDVIDHDTGARLADQLRLLVEELIRDPAGPVGSYRRLPGREHADLLRAGGGPVEDYPAGETLLDLFAAQVGASPYSTAVEYGDRRLSFRELDEAAHRLATRLSATCSTGADRPVAVVCERTEWMIVAMLAVLKTGSAFVPLDVRQPAERLARLLGETGAVGVLTDPTHAAGLAAGGIPVVALREETVPDRTPGESPAATDLAYVVCTSGSTGAPKGVAIEHRSIVNTVRHRMTWYGLSDRDRVLQIDQIHYDGGIVDIFTALAAGSTLVVVGLTQMLDPAEITNLVRTHEPTHTMVVPSLYQLLLDAASPALATLRQVVLGGERVTEALVSHHVRRLPDTELHNEYGPAENSVVSTMCRLDGGGEPPIGRPITNQYTDLLDEHGHLVPFGAAGEICVSGAGLARGYVADATLTAERFVTNPVRDGLRMYRTGDLARRTADGTLFYIGRKDEQVKIRGQRIEPGEVAAALAGAPGIRHAAVVAQPSSTGEPRLIAYVVGDATAAELRAFLAQRLPDVMMPVAYVGMPALPVTAAGKLDRSQLPVPMELAATIAPTGPAPMSDAERRVADVWSALLGHPVTEPDRSLFELGGHSLTAARVGVELGVPVSVVFAHPTVRQLARVVLGPGAPPEPATRAESRRVPLSHAQRRVWLAARRGTGDPFVIATLVRTGRPIDPDGLRVAVAAVMRRQHVLRARVEARGARADQVVADEVEVPLEVAHLPQADPDGPEVAVRLRAGRAVSFDLARAPLFRMLLITGPAGGDLLLVLAHHLIHDGASVQVLLDDLWAAYGQVEAGGAADLPPLRYTYLDWVADEQEWLTGPEAERQVQFWRDRLSGVVPSPDLVSADRRGAGRGDTGIARRVLPWEILDGSANTPFSIVVTAFTTMMSRATGVSDLVLGFAAGLRHQPAADALVGYLANAVPLRLDVGGCRTQGELLAHVSERAVEAFQHSRLPFDVMAEALGLLAPPGRSVLLDLGVSWENAMVGADTHAFEDVLPDRMPATSDMWLYASRKPDGLHLDLTYDLNLVHEAEAEDFVDQLAALVGEVLTEPETPVLPTSTPLRTSWTDTRYDF